MLLELSSGRVQVQVRIRAGLDGRTSRSTLEGSEEEEPLCVDRIKDSLINHVPSSPPPLDATSYKGLLAHPPSQV